MQQNQTETNTKVTATKFQPTFYKPFSSRDGSRPPILYAVDGLLKESAFSVLAAKPKMGKSSLSRYIATCVAKGIPCLGRTTTKGETLLISLEDPQDHVDDCLDVLGYKSNSDADIHILYELPSTIAENLAIVENALVQFPGVRLVVIDTLSKFLRVSDFNNYAEVQTAIQKLRDIARNHPHVHILALAHCKKVQTDNVFDSLLGSTAIRGETDTTIAIYEDRNERIITAEVRRGRKIPPTVIRAEIVNSEIDNAELVSNFSLDTPVDVLKAEQTATAEKKKSLNYEERVIDFLRSQGGTASRRSVLDDVEGREVSITSAIERLLQDGVVAVSGIKNSRTNPQLLTLDQSALPMYRLTSTGRIN